MKKEKAIKKLNPLFFQGIAHRGYHDQSHTENGFRAFKRALDNKLAIEFDIHLTLDNKLVVCHDSDLLRTTSKSGVIEELTLKEIKENYHLLDGSEIPTFDEVLKLCGDKIPMVIELKVYKKNGFKLGRLAYQKLKEFTNNKTNYVFISFYPQALIPLFGKGYTRQLLVGDIHPNMFKTSFMWESMDIDFNLVLNSLEMMKYSKKHLLNVWTIRNIKELTNVIPFTKMVTFENIDYLEVREKLR